MRLSVKISAHYVKFLLKFSYKFIFVDVGSKGHNSDGGIFATSSLNELLENQNLQLPEPCFLPKSKRLCPFYMAADAAFPLSQNLMKPYGGKNLPYEKKIFNYRLTNFFCEYFLNCEFFFL